MAATDLVAAGQSNMAKASLLVSNRTPARELTKLKAIAVEHRERRDVRGARVVLYTMVSSGQRGGAKNITNKVWGGDLYIIMCAVVGCTS